MTLDPYDALCDVIEDFYEAHKSSTREGSRPDGVQTPPVARNPYLYNAGLFGHPRDGRALYEFFAWVRDRDWPDRYRDGAAGRAFHARVRAGRFDLLREWVIVFDPRTRGLYSDQDRANVLRAVANAAQRIADGVA